MKVIDLTMTIDERTPVFPGSKKQEIVQSATIDEDGWNEKRLEFISHFSTHIDAPFHMIDTGKKLTDYKIETFIGDAIVIDVAGQGEIHANLDAVKEGDIVFFYTGHTEKAYSQEFFQNNPVISRETAEKLIAKKIRIVGLDSLTPDNEPYDIHKMLFRHGILIVENLVNLDKLKGKRFKCYIMPLKIKDADGAPCRIIGIV